MPVEQSLTPKSIAIMGESATASGLDPDLERIPDLEIIPDLELALDLEIPSEGVRSSEFMRLDLKIDFVDYFSRRYGEIDSETSMLLLP